MKGLSNIIEEHFSRFIAALTVLIAVSCAVDPLPTVFVSGVSLNQSDLIMTEGDSHTLVAAVTPSNAADVSVSWSSNSTSVATVDQSGNVTACKAGYATITVTTADGGYTASCVVTVIPKIYPVASISLDKTVLSLIEGEAATLNATFTPSNATNRNVTWSTSDASVATVDQNGEVYAVKAGTATITVTTEDGGKTATCEVSVLASVSGVSLNKNRLELVEGSSETLHATITPSNAANKKVTWSSSNSSVATVDDNGKVTAVKIGTATITVTTEDGGKSATCEVSVVIPVSGVSLNKSSLELNEGETETLYATVTPSDATNKVVTWKSSNTSVATVNADGKVTAVKAGTATITVTTENGGKTATCEVSVIAPVSGVSLNKTNLELIEGSSETLLATITPSNAANKKVTWSSSNSSVATVDDNGKVTAVMVGTATITVTTEDGGKTATCEVSVVIPVSGVSLNKSSLELNEGETETLYATITPSNATNKGVTWKSSNTSVATVNTDGKVTAVKAGTATITVTTKNGSKTSTCTVSVIAPVSGVSLNKTSLELFEGGSETLIATVAPSNATNKKVTWESSNASVATVSTNGTVKALVPGSVTITVTTEDGGKTATCSVTVKSLESLKGYSNNQEYIDLGLSVKWATHNIGASKTSDKGRYYLWGDPSNSATAFFYDPPYMSNICGTQYDAARSSWGGKWRMPKMADFRELVNNCSLVPATENGVSGIKVTGPSGGSIFLPLTGYGMPADGPVGSVSIMDSSTGCYMSGEANLESDPMFKYYKFTSSGSWSSNITYNARFVAMVIRPVIDL